MKRLLLALLMLTACGDSGVAPDLPGAPARIEVVGGTGQTGPAGGRAAEPLRVRVLDADGRLVTGAVVRWAADNGTLDPEVSTSNIGGIATSRLTFGAAAGPLTVTAAIGDDVSANLEFDIVPGTASSLAGITGQAQSAVVGSLLPLPLRVQVQDTFSNPVRGAAASWRVLQGAGSIADASETADSTGWVSARWTLGPRSGVQLAAVYLASGDSVIFTATATPGPLAAMSIGPATSSIEVAAQLQLNATGRDANDNPVNVPASGVTWSVSDAAVASISSNGRIRGLRPGSVTVTGRRQGRTATKQLTVLPSSVATVTLEPAALILPVGDSIRLAATARDAAGVILTGRWIDWSTSGTGGTLTAAPGAESAFLRATGEGIIRVHAAVGTTAGTAVIDVRRPRPAQFETLAAGAVYSCGVEGGRLACWGTLDSIQVVADPPGGVTSPSPILPAPALQSLQVGTFHACGLDAAGAAWCWGDGGSGRLGNGANASSAIPVAVTGGKRYTALAPGHDHTCGIEVSGVASCWGRNDDGQLGNGTKTASPIPVPVSGGHRFVDIAASYRFTCGVTTEAALLCWGYNEVAQLGTGDVSDRLTPVAIGAGPAWRTVTAGGAHACAATTAGAVQCWGNNRFNQVGNGTDVDQRVPVTIELPAAIVSLTSFGIHTCGLTGAGEAWCWGSGDAGQLGTGATTAATRPVRVPTTLRFSSLSAGALHTCGLTLEGAAWCWGDNTFGQLGDLTRLERRAPVNVLIYR